MHDYCFLLEWREPQGTPVVLDLRINFWIGHSEAGPQSPTASSGRVPLVEGLEEKHQCGSGREGVFFAVTGVKSTKPLVSDLRRI